MNKSLLISGLLSVIVLQGCNASPNATRPTSTMTEASNVTAPTPPKNDAAYATLLEQLSQRDPKAEAAQAIARNELFLLGYYSGRAGLKVPGVSAQQQATQRCKLSTIDGMGDVLYGENHLKYRIAMRTFAKTFNQAILSRCL